MSKFIINCIKFNHPVYIQWTYFMKKIIIFKNVMKRWKKKHHPRNILFMYHIIKSFKTLCLHLIHVSHFRFAIERVVLKFQLERKARPACLGAVATTECFEKAFLTCLENFFTQHRWVCTIWQNLDMNEPPIWSMDTAHMVTVPVVSTNHSEK